MSSHHENETAELGVDDTPQNTGNVKSDRLKLYKIPEEVMQMVLGFLNAEELKESRLVCKKFGRLGRRFLCRNINVTEVSESFQRLMEISQEDQEIQMSVEHLTYMPFSLNRKLRKSDFVAQDLHGVHLDEYKHLVADRKELAQKSHNIGYLRWALQSLHPKSISICPQITSAWDNCTVIGNHDGLVVKRPIDHAAYPNFRPVISCSHKIFNELERRRTIDTGALCTRLGCSTRSFLAILFALDQSQSQIKMLEAAVSLSFLKHSIISAVPRSGFKYLTVLKLKLLVSGLEGLAPPSCLNPMSGALWDCGEESPPPGDSASYTAWLEAGYNDSILGDFILGASFLEELDLEIDREQIPDGQRMFIPGLQISLRAENEIAILGPHSWQHLKTLRLTYFNCDLDSLVEIIMRHKDTLKHIELSDLHLVSPTNVHPHWPTLFETIRDSVLSGDLNFQSIELNGIFSRQHKFGDVRAIGLGYNNGAHGKLLSKWILDSNGSTDSELQWSSFVETGKDGKHHLWSVFPDDEKHIKRGTDDENEKKEEEEEDEDEDDNTENHVWSSAAEHFVGWDEDDIYEDNIGDEDADVDDGDNEEEGEEEDRENQLWSASAENYVGWDGNDEATKDLDDGDASSSLLSSIGGNWEEEEGDERGDVHEDVHNGDVADADEGYDKKDWVGNEREVEREQEGDGDEEIVW